MFDGVQYTENINCSLEKSRIISYKPTRENKLQLIEENFMARFMLKILTLIF